MRRGLVNENRPVTDAEEHRDELPDELDASSFVGPYMFPNNNRRRVPAVLYVLFGVVAWIVPGRAANLVGSGLGLSGSLIAGVAAGSARSLLLVHSLVQSAQRVISPMLSRR